MSFKQRRMLVILAILLVIGAFLALVLVLTGRSDPGSGEEYAQAEIIGVTDNYADNPDSDASFSQQTITLEIQSGKHDGETIETINTLGGNPLIDVEMTKGSVVLVTLTEENGRITGSTIASTYRLSTLILFTVLVVLLVVLMGGGPGIKSLVIVLAVLVGLFKVMLPAVISGSDPLALLIIVVAVLSIFITVINNGFNLISLTALAGTVTSCLLASLAAYFLLDTANISGFASIESRMGYYMEHFTFNMQLLLFCGIVLSSLGAVADICQAVARSMDEYLKREPEIDLKRLFIAGIQTGRVRLQSLISILCMAFCGVLVPWLAFYLAYSESLRYIMNTELVAGEVIRLLACYLCLGLALPVTALYSLAVQIGLERSQASSTT